jgi:hypothetical protein
MAKNTPQLDFFAKKHHTAYKFSQKSLIGRFGLFDVVSDRGGTMQADM